VWWKSVPVRESTVKKRKLVKKNNKKVTLDPPALRGEDLK